MTYGAWVVATGSDVSGEQLVRTPFSPAENGDASARSILMVAPSWPHPPTWGFAMRVYHLAKQLSRRHRISLLTYGSPEIATAEGRSIFESVHFVKAPASVRSKRPAQVRSLLSSRSHHFGGLRSRAMESALDQLLSERKFDIVQVESSQMAFAAERSGVPVALDEHNVEYRLLERLAAAESSALRKAFGRLEAAKARPEELRAWARCNGSVFTSKEDLAVMRQTFPDKPACVVPNGVDVDHFKPAMTAAQPNTVVFTGAINYRPNTDAVAFFVREVMPRLRRVRPAARFVVVGQGAPEWLIGMSGPYVEFTGAVRDVRPYLAMAAVVVAPLRVGSGTRLKILEAMAMGKAVVTTSVGCEGLGVVDGEHLQIADDAEQFAQETARLMSERDSSEQLGRQARALAERDYSWPVIVHRLEQFHTQLIGKETRRVR